MLDVPFVMTLRHSLSGSINWGSAAVGLGWGGGTCGVLP